MNSRKLVYVAGKYLDVTREQTAANVALAEEHGKKILIAGHVPVIPHKITSFWDEDSRLADWSHSNWIEDFCFPLLEGCAAIYMVPNWENSVGAKREMNHAMVLRIPIVFDIDELKSAF